MNTSLLSKASFALLLLIFGCLVYVIVHDHRLDVLRRPQVVPQAQAAADPPAASPPPANAPAEPEPFAPLRPRSFPSVPPPMPTMVGSRTGSSAAPSAVLAGWERPSRGTSAVAPPASADFSAFAGTSSGVAGSGGATVTGQVLLRGTPPPEKQIVLDPVCGRLHSGPLTTRNYVVGSTGGLAEVFVYIKSGSVSIGPPIAQTVLLDQVGCDFQPYVLGVQAGQTLLVRNSDSTLHKVHVESRSSRERSISQATRGMTASFVFPRTEVFVRFKCDIHPWMFAYVGVVDHPWFAITDREGKFTLPGGLSPGRYTLAAVHPKAGELTQQITVVEGATDPVTFTFEVSEGANLSALNR